MILIPIGTIVIDNGNDIKYCITILKFKLQHFLDLLFNFKLQTKLTLFKLIDYNNNIYFLRAPISVYINKCYRNVRDKTNKNEGWGGK